MSGGSLDYICFTLQSACEGQMHDAEMELFLTDFVKVLHDLERWQSGDTGEKDFRKTLTEFKSKWFGNIPARTERLMNLIQTKCKELVNELMLLIGESEGNNATD